MMLNFGRFFVDVQPEKLTIKYGNTADLALTALVVERNHVDGFVTKWGIPDTTVEKLADLLS